MLKHALILSLAIGSMIALGSCKKNDATPIVPTYGSLLFRLHTNVDTSEVNVLGQVYTMTGGRRITVNKAQLYISGVQLVQSDELLTPALPINVLKKQQQEEYTIGSVAAGNYVSLKFNVGLSSSANATVPSVSDSILHRTDMWFNSSAFIDSGGFVFVDFEGTIDTATTPLPGNDLIPFAYRIGTNTFLESIKMPDKNFTVAANQPVEINMVIDYSKLFNGIQLNSGSLSVTTAAENNSWSWAAQIAYNIPSMFRYEQ